MCIYVKPPDDIIESHTPFLYTNENEHIFPSCICVYPWRKILTSISDLRGHTSRRSEIQTEYSLAISKKLEYCQARVSFILD